MSNQYLHELPNANQLVQTNETGNSELVSIETQSQQLVEQLASLSPNNDTVTVQLTQPLHENLHRELVEKGYNVTQSNSWTSINGQNSSQHYVTVSLPSAQRGSRFRKRIMHLPIFPFPPTNRFYRDY